MDRPLSLAVGSLGRFRASLVEFEIVESRSAQSVIRYRWEREPHVVADSELTKLAYGLGHWGEKKEEPKNG